MDSRIDPGYGNGNPSPVGQGQGSMQKLWEGIHFSRLSIENDRKAYEKARSEIDSLNEKINSVSRQCATASSRIREAQEVHAIRSTELSHYDIRDMVLNESLARVEEEVRHGWDNLTATRKKAMEVTSRYLSESSYFAQMWNCTELGRSNREALRAKEVEDLRRMKHRMEYDLEEFLVKLNRVKEAKQEMADLEKEFRGQEAVVKSREDEAYKRLRETDEVLDQLWKKQDVMTRECEDEVTKLQQKIQQVRESISHWERRVSENQRTVEQQRCQASKDKSPVTTNAGFSNRFMNQQNNQNMVGLNTNVSANKTARIYQPVKPTPKATQSANVTQNPNGKKPVFQKPPAANPSGSSVNTQQQSSLTSYSFTNSGRSNENNNQSSTHTYRSDNCVSLPSSTFFPNKSASAAATGRVFQFKKKSMDGSEKSPTNGVINGPTPRSVTVTLGNTPFSTFQNGRAVLQQQQRSNQNQNNFSNDKR